MTKCPWCGSSAQVKIIDTSSNNCEDAGTSYCETLKTCKCGCGCEFKRYDKTTIKKTGYCLITKNGERKK